MAYINPVFFRGYYSFAIGFRLDKSNSTVDAFLYWLESDMHGFVAVDTRLVCNKLFLDGEPEQIFISGDGAVCDLLSWEANALGIVLYSQRLVAG